MKLVLTCGTRPEFIKMSPIIKECERQDIDYFILHTGQHYSYNLDGVFFKQLGLPNPKYNLGINETTYAGQFSKMVNGISKVLTQEKPDVIIVEGDTISAISGAISAHNLNIKVGHVEAGLRSYYSGMPEEINRIIIDHISDRLFAPTEKTKQILIAEGICGDKIDVTGNTIVDAVYQNLDKLEKINGLYIRKRGYILLTLHRQENVDNVERFRDILDGLELVARTFGIPIIYPIHPRSKKMIEYHNLKAGFLKIIEPVDYFQFLLLEQDARLIFTDSGGVQEESCILGTPCVTLRDNTERPETIEVGANILAGTEPNRILAVSQLMINKQCDWFNPFGDGKTGERIVNILKESYGK